MRPFPPRQSSHVVLIVLALLAFGPVGLRAAEAPAKDVAADEVKSRLKDAVPKGLQWLAARQDERGRFADAQAALPKEVALTALSGLAFVAGGNEPEKGQYSKQLRAAVEAVLAAQQPSGLFTESKQAGPMYGHGYATLFLAEVQRKHADAATRNALQKSIELLQKSVAPEGGWRYQPKPIDADISVTACELNALLASRAAKIAVDPKLIDNATRYVRQCQNPDGGFSYMAGQGVGSGLPRSAAGLAVLLHGGASIDADPDVRRGVAYVATAMAKGGRAEGHYFYGRYYASQWLADDPAARERWNALARELLDAQQPDGSWKDEIGSVYATASALIILQAPQKQLWIFSQP